MSQTPEKLPPEDDLAPDDEQIDLPKPISNHSAEAETAPLHISVLSQEVLHWLQPRPGGIFVDGTLGAGGHTRALAEAVGPQGLVVALDRDPAAIASAERRLKGLPVMLAQTNFADLPEVLKEVQIDKVDGVLLDLGMSSDQLADHARGFSYEADGLLDMRFDPDRGEPAWKLLERLKAESLADLLREFGEERASRHIARAVVQRRQTEPIRTARQFAELVRRIVQAHSRSRDPNRLDPATRSFQALRIAVNQELQSLQSLLARVADSLSLGGRVAVISFHSLEDRLVKEAFRNDPRLENLTKKPIGASEEEVSRNIRARSAKLRVAARVEPTGDPFPTG